MNSSTQTLLEVITTDVAESNVTGGITPSVAPRRMENESMPQWHAAVIGSVVSVDQDGTPCVDFANNPAVLPLAARTTVTLSRADVGSQAVLLFEDGDPSRPIVVGKIATPAVTTAPAPQESSRTVGITSDGERLTLSADREIVLRCGEASITLTRAGKVLICGSYVLTRSDGVNRIKGGSVQIN